MRSIVSVPRTIAILVLALAGPPLLAIASKLMIGDSNGVLRMLPFDLLLWAVLSTVLGIVVRVERQTLESIGVKPVCLSTVVMGLLLVVGINFVLNPATMWCVKKMGFAGYEYGLTRLMMLPAWYRVFLAVSAGVVEESLYRGYAIERLASLTGSYRTGGFLAVVAFGVAHIPAWNLGPSLAFLVDGAAATLFYVWRRDLVALVIAHVAGDLIGLVIIPPVGSG